MKYEVDNCLECNEVLTFENSGNRVLCKECQITKAEHKQVESDFGPLIDEELVDIINVFYDLNIMTNNSCQEQTGLSNKRHNNKTWICFDSLEDVKRFMNICKFDTNFHKYILNQDWDIVVEPKDILYPPIYEYSLRFPYKDLDYFKHCFFNCYEAKAKDEDDISV